MRQTETLMSLPHDTGRRRCIAGPHASAGTWVRASAGANTTSASTIATNGSTRLKLEDGTSTLLFHALSYFVPSGFGYFSNIFSTALWIFFSFF